MAVVPSGIWRYAQISLEFGVLLEWKEQSIIRRHGCILPRLLFSPICFGNVDDKRKSILNFEGTTFVGAIILRKLSSERSRKLLSASSVYSCKSGKVFSSFLFALKVWFGGMLAVLLVSLCGSRAGLHWLCLSRIKAAHFVQNSLFFGDSSLLVNVVQSRGRI